MFGTLARTAGGVILGGAIGPLRYRIDKLAWSIDPCIKMGLDDYMTQFLNLWQTPESMKDHAKELGAFWETYQRDWFSIFLQRPRPTAPTGYPREILRLDIPNMSRNMSQHAKHFQFDKAVLAPQEVLELYLRGLIDAGVAQFILAQHFNGEVDLVEQYMKLANDIPPTQDLIQFGVKDSFDLAIVEKYGYNKELPSRILPYMQMQGLGGESGIAMPAGSTTIDGPDLRTKAQWFDHYWWSHWTNIAPGQVYEMGQRFYPISPYGPSPEVLTPAGVVDPDLATTPDVIADALKVNDYAPYWRKRLERLSYKTLTRVDARRIYNQNLMTDADLYHAYRGMGYSDKNAQFLLNWSIREKNNARFAKVRNRVIKDSQKLVKLGVFDEASFKTRLEAVGIPEEERNLLWTQALTEQSAEALEKSLKFIRRWYITGSLPRDQAVQLMNQLGVIRSIQDRYFQIWDSEKFMGLKFIAADKAVGMYKKRLVNSAQLTNKLLNLGYTGAETSLIIDEANLDMRSTEQKQLVKAEKENAKQQLAIVREQQKQATQTQATQKRLADKSVAESQKRLAKSLAPFTEKNIVKWFKAGDLNEQAVDLILNMKGWNQAAIYAFKHTDLGIPSTSDNGAT